MRPIACNTRRALLTSAALGFVSLALAGCGGGGGNPSGSGGAPTAVTRAKVQELSSLSAQSLARGGAPVMVAGPAAQEDLAGAPPPGAGTAGQRPLPNIGAFIHSVAAVPSDARARAVRAMVTRHGPTVEPTPPTDEPLRPDLPPIEFPTFYYDEYLGLWVEIKDTPASSSYLLYEDEGKTRPAGSIVTEYPADWESFPQVYASRYEFTAGFLAGSHGFYETVVNADFSSRSAYENVYADGWHDKGQSRWTARGDSTWSSRIDAPDGYWATDRGTFRANGSGGTHMETSDGYVTDYVFNADGSGHGRISGPAPGLPATITWDAFGHITIRYADGTVEHLDAWGFHGGGGGSGAVGSGGSGVAAPDPREGAS